MSHGMSEEIKRLHRLLDRKDSGADDAIITNEKIIADLRDERTTRLRWRSGIGGLDGCRDCQTSSASVGEDGVRLLLRQQPDGHEVSDAL